MDNLRENLLAAYVLWRRDMVRFVRDRSSVISALGQPIFFLVVFGVGLATIIPDLGGSLDFKQFLYPGILAMTVLFSAVYSGVTVVIDRQFGFLKAVVVAPVSRSAIVLGKVAGGSTVAFIQGILMLVLAPLVGVRLPWEQLPVLAGALLLMACAMTSLGTLMALRQRTVAGFHMFMNFVLLPMFFLSGSFFPLDGVPVWMKGLAIINPVTYGVDPLRRAFLQGMVPPPSVEALTFAPILTSLAALAIFGLAFFLGAMYEFNRQA